MYLCGKNRYRMQFKVAYCNPPLMRSPFAQNFFTVIEQGYTASGGGFNFTPAGLSTEGEMRSTEAETELHEE